jgi:hypothetical protein
LIQSQGAGKLYIISFLRNNIGARVTRLAVDHFQFI